MRLTNLPEGVSDWSNMAAETVPGAAAQAASRSRQIGEVQQRIVEYAPGYLADHWCSKGHILYVLAGRLLIEHEDRQRPHALSAGMSWHVADDSAPAHRVRSETGATVFIVD